jgi:hypothetical protein
MKRKRELHVKEKKSEMKSKSPKSPYDISLEESWPLDQIVKRLQD